jgi:carboxymethylenebutenolidase
MSNSITLQSADGHRFEAARSDPAGKPKGGVVVLHAIYGLTTHIAGVCDQWAGAGYAAIAPALFDRVGKGLVHPYGAAGGEAGRKCYLGTSEANILAEIAACAGAMKDCGPSIVSGYCTGGTWAWVASAKQRFDAQVNFYGSHVAQKLDLHPKCPTVMHYGDKDHVVPVPDIERIQAANPGVLIHIYPGGGHAFFNPEQEHYAAGHATLAWQRSLAFLDGQLAGG